LKLKQATDFSKKQPVRCKQRAVSLELVQASLPVAKTGSFFVSFCIFEGA
jgi:hypothetical protein